MIDKVRLQIELLKIFGNNFSVKDCDYNLAWEISAKLNNKEYNWIVDKKEISLNKKVILDFDKNIDLIIREDN